MKRRKAGPGDRGRFTRTAIRTNGKNSLGMGPMRGGIRL